MGNRRLRPASHSQGGIPVGDVMRYRPTILQALVLPALCVLTGFGIVAIGASFNSAHAIGPLLDIGLKTSAATGVMGFILSRSDCVDFQEDQVLARGTRRWRIHRNEITGVEVDHMLGMRVIFICHSGRRTRLHTPTSFFDNQFDNKVRKINLWVDKGNSLPGA